MTDIQLVEKITESIRSKRIQNVIWTPKELVFMEREKYRSKLLENLEVTFMAAAIIKFRNSLFGTYLDAFNRQQNQDKFLNNNKLEITNWDLRELTPIQKEILKGKNDIMDDVYSLLVKAVNKEECISWEFLFENVITLRIAEFHITFIDDCYLKKFKNLQVLILSGNWLIDVPGYKLPRKLKYLELFTNEISSVGSLCQKPPRNLLHIGLGRNKITNCSNFEVLQCSTKFKLLRSLDLSDNDIYGLVEILELLTVLTELHSLQLEGNPCATCMVYKNAVLSLLPQLLYLDKTQVLERDRTDTDFVRDDTNKAALTFTCHRIIGLPAPPKQKGVIQTIHLEVSLPLLEEIDLGEPENPEEEKLEEIPTGKTKGGKNKGGKNKGDKNKDKKSKSDKSKGSKTKSDKSKGSKTKSDKSKGSKSKSGKSKGGKGKQSSPYDAPDEYATEQKLNVKNTSFKTKRLGWAKILQFPEEAIIAESPEFDLTAIRDTFRSSVNVKVIYLKVQPPPKPKKGKPAPAKEAPEIILRKVTLANFFCDLHSVNWSDQTIDFHWAAHPKCDPKAIPVEGSLRVIKYVEGKRKGKKSDKKSGKKSDKKSGKGGKKSDKKSEKGGKKSDKKSGKGGKKSDKKSEKGSKKSDKKSKKGGAVESVFRVPSKEFIPSIFTCQIGFGLKRSYSVLCLVLYSCNLNSLSRISVS